MAALSFCLLGVAVVVGLVWFYVYLRKREQERDWGNW